MIIKSGTLPVVSINCVSCRESNQYTISSGYPIKVLGNCVNCGFLWKTTYAWRIFREDNVELLLNQSTSTTGVAKRNLVINQGVLSTDHSYVFYLTVTSSKLKEEGYAQLEMLHNQPPTGGWCNISGAEDGIAALIDRIEVFCEGWYDPDDITNAPLTYEVNWTIYYNRPLTYEVNWTIYYNRPLTYEVNWTIYYTRPLTL